MPTKRVRKKRVKTAEEGRVDDFGIPIPGKKKKRKEPSPEELKYMLERELRRYVKRSGGFRKNLSKSHEETAKRIMKRLDRKKPEWDFNIVVFGVDQHTVARLNVDKS